MHRKVGGLIDDKKNIIFVNDSVIKVDLRLRLTLSED